MSIGYGERERRKRKKNRWFERARKVTQREWNFMTRKDREERRKKRTRCSVRRLTGGERADGKIQSAICSSLSLSLSLLQTSRASICFKRTHHGAQTRYPDLRVSFLTRHELKKKDRYKKLKKKKPQKPGRQRRVETYLSSSSSVDRKRGSRTTQIDKPVSEKHSEEKKER